MAQKKPTPPFEQHSSSSDDDEEVESESEEEEEPNTRDVVGMMGYSDDTFKKVFELLSDDDEAKAALEDKWKNMVIAELELSYKRLELSREMLKKLSGHRG